MKCLLTRPDPRNHAHDGQPRRETRRVRRWREGELHVRPDHSHTNLEAKRPNLKGRLNDRRDAMREAIPDREVPNVAIDALVPCLNLPDPDDAHVLAAAIAGHADCIVTANLRDFPASVVAPFGIEVMHPERFILSQWDLAPYPTIAAFKRMRKRWRRPLAEPEDFARAFDRGGLPAVAGRIREASEII